MDIDRSAALARVHRCVVSRNVRSTANACRGAGRCRADNPARALAARAGPAGRGRVRGGRRLRGRQSPLPQRLRRHVLSGQADPTGRSGDAGRPLISVGGHGGALFRVESWLATGGHGFDTGSTLGPSSPNPGCRECGRCGCRTRRSNRAARTSVRSDRPAGQESAGIRLHLVWADQ